MSVNHVSVPLDRAGPDFQWSQWWFASILHCVTDGIVVAEANGLVQFLNPVAEELTGWPLSEARGMPVDLVVNVGGTTGGEPTLASRALIGEGAGDVAHALWLTKREGDTARVDETVSTVRDEDGQILGAIVVLRDATTRLRQDARLRRSEEHFRSMFDHAPLGMALISMDGRFVRVNELLRRFLGRGAEILAMSHEAVTFDEDIAAERQRLAMLLASRDEEVAQFEKRYKHADGRVLWSLVSISLLRDRDEPMCYLYQIHDLTDRKELEDRMRRMAYSDPLTGLANRAHLHTELDRLLAFARRQQQRLAVVYMDLDRFKHINDTLGHEAGDHLLQEIAKRLGSTLREVDCIARIGGDEFVMVLSGVHSADDIVQVLEKLRQAVLQPMQLAGKSLSVTPSLGVSVYPNDGAEADELLRHADMALYAAKSEGRNRYSFFKSQWTQQAGQRQDVQSLLARAVETDSLRLVYQPIVRLEDGSIVRFEALLRWQAPSGLVEPAVFIPMAESSGLIHEIGAWVLDQACAFAAQCPAGVSVDINCSAAQLTSAAFPELVMQALARHGIKAEKLGLDVAERIAGHGDSAQVRQIGKLKQMGMRLSVDDYGSGASSLANLNRFAFDRMKLDTRFVQALGDVAGDGATVLAAMVAVARCLGLDVVAEGVETEAQLRQLQALGCEQAQGFYFSPPVSASDALAMLQARMPAPA